MRRLFIIFLLAILPIQAAVAAACAYCPDSCMLETDAATAEDAAFSDAAALDDDDCGRCQPGGAGMLPSPCACHLPPSPEKLSLFDSGSLRDTGKADRPERPNWERAA